MSLDDKRSGTGKSARADRRKSLGRSGEIVARVYLESNGFLILSENYRRRCGEVDLVVYKDRMLAFVEVKTRNEDDPVDLIVDTYSETQMNRLSELSETWIFENEDRLPVDFDLRYDLVVVGSDGKGGLEVKEHIADVFRAR